MNKYLIAALYVMAGCAVTIPLKGQANGESLRGERCRLVITNTVKVISVYMEEETGVQEYTALPPDYFHFPKCEVFPIDFLFDKTIHLNDGPLCHTFHKIRAPESK